MSVKYPHEVDIISPKDILQTGGLYRGQRYLRIGHMGKQLANDPHHFLFTVTRTPIERSYVRAAHTLFGVSTPSQSAISLNDHVLSKEQSAHCLNVAFCSLGYTEGQSPKVKRDARRLLKQKRR